MKKLIVVVAVLILLQLVFVSAGQAAPPASGPVKYGYYQGYCGQQPYYGQRYYSNRAYYGYHPNTYYRANYGYNYRCYSGSCYRR